MISFKHTGDFGNTSKYLKKIQKFDISCLDRFGQEGVEALASATPKDSGKTARSWYYTIEKKANSTSIIWKNSNVNNGVPIAIILQYGHGTGTGGYVQGRDYINPAIRPIFDRLADSAWKEVTKS